MTDKNQESQAEQFYNINIARQRIEEFLIRAVISNPKYAKKLSPDSLVTPHYKKFLNCILAHIKKENPLSNKIIFSYLTPLIPDKVQSQERLSLLCEPFPIEDYEWKTHISQLKDIMVRESMLKICDSIKDRIRSTEPALSILNAGHEITDLASKLDSDTKITLLSDALISLRKTIVDARKSGVKKGVDYPIEVLKEILHTLYPSDLVVIAARPAVGKTALGVALTYGIDEPSGFVSSEMANEQLAGRYISSKCGIEGSKLRNPELMSDQEFDIFDEALSSLMSKRIYLEDKGAINIGEIEEKVEEWVNIGGVKVVVVDYAQRLNSDRKHGTDAERIGHITKRLKELAKRLGICIVLLAQINRDSVKGDRRPRVHDIKGCGDIEQEADIIILLHKPAMGTSEQNEECIIEFIIEKNRHGMVGIAISRYIPKYLAFKTPTDEDVAKARANEALK